LLTTIPSKIEERNNSMSPFEGFDSVLINKNIGPSIGTGLPNSVTKPTPTPQNFLTGFASRLLGPVLAPGISAIKNKDLIQQGIQGNPSALSQAMINVGGAAAGIPGAALIGADQLLKLGSGKGIVSRTEDLYRQNQQPNFMPGAGRQGFGGLF
jgi:hypothetical protein